MIAADTDFSGLASEEAEISVIGGLMLDPTAWDAIAGLITEHDFYARRHRIVYRAIARLIERGSGVDVITVATFLDSVHQLDDAGGLPWLSEVVQIVPSAARIGQYAELVREHSILRRLASTGREIHEAVLARNGRTARELMDLAQGKIMAVDDIAKSKQAEFTRVSALAMTTLSRIDDLHKRPNKTEVTGLATGFEDLDAMTTGLHPGDLVILAARPSMGKTAMSLNIAESAARGRKKVAFFSLEMINDQLMVRLMSSVARLNQHRVKIGRLNEEEWRTLTRSSEALSDYPIWLCEQSNLSITEVKAMARRMHREAIGLDLIVIDYLQLMRGGDKRQDSRAQEVEEISRGLKGLAKELHVPIIALSQLNRSLESRPNKRPIMSDLRDSGSIEQDADVILFIYRDEVYNEDSPDKGLAELIIGKQRNGPIGTVHLNFIHEQTRFETRLQRGPLPSQQMKQEKRAARQSRTAPTPAGHFRAKMGYGDVDEVPM